MKLKILSLCLFSFSLFAQTADPKKIAERQRDHLAQKYKERDAYCNSLDHPAPMIDLCKSFKQKLLNEYADRDNGELQKLLEDARKEVEQEAKKEAEENKDRSGSGSGSASVDSGGGKNVASIQWTTATACYPTYPEHGCTDFKIRK